MPALDCTGVQLFKNIRLDRRLLLSTFQSFLEQDTVPQAPPGVYLFVSHFGLKKKKKQNLPNVNFTVIIQSNLNSITGKDSLIRVSLAGS